MGTNGIIITATAPGGLQTVAEKCGGGGGKLYKSAALAAAGGLVYFVSDAGVTRIVRPGPEFELVAENPIGERCYASPAISGGQILLRGERHLFCIGTRP